MADKVIVSVSQNPAKSLADGVVQLAVFCIYMRRIGYDSATVNIFVTEDELNHIHLSSLWFLVVVFIFIVRAEFQAAAFISVA